MADTPPLTDPRASTYLAEFERARALRSIAVPTNDNEVRDALRKHGEPITLFGEDAALRRDRLRKLLLERREDAEGDVDMDEIPLSDAEEEEEEEEEFYTHGTSALLEARKEMALYSLKRSARVVAYQRGVESQFTLDEHREVRNGVKTEMKRTELWGSQTSTRPTSIVRFPAGTANASPDVVAAGDWSGQVRLLSIPDLEVKQTLGGHRAQVRGLAWHPFSTGSLAHPSPQPLDLATGGSEGTIHLWSLASTPTDTDAAATAPGNTTPTPITTLQPPLDRDPARRSIRSIAFHPSGTYLATASEDTTFHLYSLHRPHTPSLLSTTEAHALAPHTLSFSPTGALLLSAGADAHGRIWDLRSGRTIMLLSGHMRDIHSSAWAPDGYRVLTGSADASAILWDVRMVRETSRVVLNANGVTDVRWFQGDGSDGVLRAMNDGAASAGAHHQPRPSTAGSFILSSGFDKCVQMTSADDWVPMRRLEGHASHVLSCDVSGDGRWVVSGGYDRTVKLWGRG